MFYVVSGEFRFWCGDDVVDLGIGRTIVLPPNVRHQWKNIGATPSRLFAMVTPGGFEQNFIDLSNLDEITETAIVDIEAGLGVTSDAAVVFQPVQQRDSAQAESLPLVFPPAPDGC